MVLQLEANIQIEPEELEIIQEELEIIYHSDKHMREEIIEFLSQFIVGFYYPKILKNELRSIYKNYFYKTTINEVETPYLYNLKLFFQEKLK